jgi:phosphatidylinositol dimannoside acyltransferase
VLSRLLLQFLQTSCSISHPAIRRSTARAIAGAQFRLSAARRAAVLNNLATIGASGHPELADEGARVEVARRVFESFQLAWIEYFAERARSGRASGHSIRFRGTELLYRAVSGGRGAVIAAPHLGRWEIAGAALARMGLAVHAVSGVQLHPFFAREIRTMKERQGVRVHTPEEGFAPLVQALRRGGIVVLLVDGDVYSRSLPATFFGRRIPFPAGPAILARRADVPIVHAHAARDPSGRHRVSFDGMDEPDRSLPLREDLSRLTALVARSQERNIAAHVNEWCIFRPLWSAADSR